MVTCRMAQDGEGEQRGHRGNCYALIMIEGDRGWGEDGRSGCEVPGLRD